MCKVQRSHLPSAFHLILGICAALFTISANTAVPGHATNKPIVLGLISKCTHHHDHHSHIQKNTVGETASKYMAIFSPMLLRDFIYKEIDTCNQGDLIEALVTIFNDEEYADRSGTKVKHIVSYMSEEMLKTLLSVVSFSTSTIVWPLQTVKDQVWFRNHPNFKNFHQRVVQKPKDVVVEMVEAFSWQNVHIVDVVTDPTGSARKVGEQIDFRKLFQKTRCISYSNFTESEIVSNSTRLMDELRQLKEEMNTPVVFLHGKKGNLYKEKALELELDKYWIIFKVKSKHRGGSGSSIQTKHPETTKKYEHISILNSGVVLYFHLLPFSDDTCSENAPSDICPDLSTRTEIMEKNIPTRCLNIAQWKRNQTYTKLEYIQYLEDGSQNKIQTMDSIIRTKALDATQRNSKCTTCVYCDAYCPGNKTLGYVNPGALYKRKGITCGACPPDCMINTFGECQPCPEGMHLSTVHDNVCYDPIRPFQVSPVCHVLTGIGLATTLVTIVVYSLYRKTPVVKSSNYELSMVQLVSCVLMHLASIVLTTSLEPSVMVCTIRPIVYSTLLVAVAAIVVCKAEKILIIFFTKHLLTKKNIKDIGIRQLVIFGFLISINFILVPASFTIPASVETAPISETKNGDTYYYKYCSSDVEFYIQSIYAVAILVLAIFQGYRGRKLPTNYNEGNSILLASVMTISALIFCMWTLKTSLYAHNPYLVLNSMSASLTVALIFLVTCLYGVKVFVILFQASKNTKTYQVNIMLADALKRTEKKVLNPLMNSRKRGGSMLKLVDSRGGDGEKRKKSTQSLTRFRTLSIDDL